MAIDHQSSQSMQAAIGAALASAEAILSPASLAIGIAGIALASLCGGHVPAWAHWLALAVQAGSMALALGLGVRLRIDRRLFDELHLRDDLENFDRTMVALNLMPSSKAGRSMAARIAGTLRLLRWQGFCPVAQLLALGIWGALAWH